MNLDFSKLKVLVIGDFMIDYYVIGESNRLSPEAPVPVITPIKKYSVPGGAGNVALNLDAMGAKVSCIGIIGDDHWGKEMMKLLPEGVDKSNFIISQLYPTIVKKRVYLKGKQVFRLDEEKLFNHSHDNEINSCVNNILKKYDIIILSDYNKGVLNDITINHIINTAKALNIPTIIDPKKENFSIYKEANILTPNLNELKKATQMNVDSNDSIISASKSLIENNNFDYIITTRAERGMTIVGKNFAKHIKAHSIENPDVTGAGDTVVSTLALVFANTKDIELSANIANIAAGIAVSQTGTVYVKLDDIKRKITS
jgi:rfaE bifunctional protein kinase chain/domain